MNEEDGFASTRVMQPMWDDRRISDGHYYRSQWARVICNGIDIRCVLVEVVPPSTITIVLMQLASTEL